MVGSQLQVRFQDKHCSKYGEGLLYLLLGFTTIQEETRTRAKRLFLQDTTPTRQHIEQPSSRTWSLTREDCAAPNRLVLLTCLISYCLWFSLKSPVPVSRSHLCSSVLLDTSILP
jgi:hypothetical protein